MGKTKPHDTTTPHESSLLCGKLEMHAAFHSGYFLENGRTKPVGPYRRPKQMKPEGLVQYEISEQIPLFGNDNDVVREVQECFVQNARPFEGVRATPHAGEWAL